MDETAIINVQEHDCYGIRLRVRMNDTRHPFSRGGPAAVIPAEPIKFR